MKARPDYHKLDLTRKEKEENKFKMKVDALAVRLYFS